MRRDFTLKKYLRTVSIVILFASIIGYGVWISRDLLFGITISVSGISDGESVADPVISLGGTARHASTLKIDGHSVPLSQSGVWTDTLVLLPGYNIVTVGAVDKFGQTKTTSYRVYYTPPTAVQ